MAKALLVTCPALVPEQQQRSMYGLATLGSHKVPSLEACCEETPKVLQLGTMILLFMMSFLCVAALGAGPGVWHRPPPVCLACCSPEGWYVEACGIDLHVCMSSCTDETLTHVLSSA